MAGSLAAAGRDLVDPEASTRLAERRLAGTLFRYGLPIVLANLFYQTIPLVDRLVIAHNFGLAQSGQFSFAYDIGVRVVAAVGSMLDVLLFQIAVKADEHHGGEEGRRQVGRNVGLVLAILAPACAGLWLVLPSFERLVVPAEFHGAFARNLAFLLPGLFCYGVVFFALNPMFQIVKKTGPLVAVALGASAVNLVALAVLPSAVDSFALAQGIALSAAVVLLVVWAGRSLRPFWPPARDIAGVLGGTAAVVATAWWTGRAFEPGMLLILLQIGASAAVYGLVVAALDLCGLRTLATTAWCQTSRVRGAGPAPLFSVWGCAESGDLIQGAIVTSKRLDHGTSFVTGPSGPDRSRGFGGEFDPAGCGAVRCEPVVGDQADAAGPGDGQHGHRPRSAATGDLCSMVRRCCCRT